MTVRALIAPAGTSIRKSKYARGYYLLKSLAESSPNISIDAFTRSHTAGLSAPNLSVETIYGDQPYYLYHLCAFNLARRKLQTEEYDLYHHMNFPYRFHNLTVAGGFADDVPTIIGPAEPPHTIPDSRLKGYLRRNLPVDLSDGSLGKLVPIAKLARPIANIPRAHLFKKSLKRVDRLVAVNEDTAEIYAEHIPRSKIDVIPYGVDPSRFDEATPSESTDIITIGNLHRRKGFDILLSAWSQITAEYQDATLHILGKGDERDALENQANRLGIRDRVRFHGYVDRDVLVERLASSRAFVHPSRSEGYGHVRLEAMASGLPVIGTDITGAREMVRDGVDGVITPVGDATALSHAMSSLLANPGEADQMGANAKERVETIFKWRHIGGQYADLYRELEADYRV